MDDSQNRSTHSSPRHWMEVKYFGERAPYTKRIDELAVPPPVWEHRGRENILSLMGIESRRLGRRARSLVTIRNKQFQTNHTLTKRRRALLDKLTRKEMNLSFIFERFKISASRFANFHEWIRIRRIGGISFSSIPVIKVSNVPYLLERIGAEINCSSHQHILEQILPSSIIVWSQDWILNDIN